MKLRKFCRLTFSETRLSQWNSGMINALILMQVIFKSSLEPEVSSMNFALLTLLHQTSAANRFLKLNI